MNNLQSKRWVLVGGDYMNTKVISGFPGVGKSYLFKDSTEAEEYLNISKGRITTAINLKSLLAKRYRVEYRKISIEKLTYKCL